MSLNNSNHDSVRPTVLFYLHGGDGAGVEPGQWAEWEVVRGGWAEAGEWEAGVEGGLVGGDLEAEVIGGGQGWVFTEIFKRKWLWLSQ